MPGVLSEFARIAYGPPHNFAAATVAVYSAWIKRLYRAGSTRSYVNQLAS